MQASATAKLLKWGCSLLSVSCNGFGIDRDRPSLTANANKPNFQQQSLQKKATPPPPTHPQNMCEVGAEITHIHTHKHTH